MNFCKNFLQDSQSLQKLHLVQKSLKECVWPFYIALTFLDTSAQNYHSDATNWFTANVTKTKNSSNLRMNQNYKSWVPTAVHNVKNRR